ncbi:MAG: hypothetical protein LUH22_13580 [Bacteroides sp.]|nr:hypothetical protein [Bacteroides sp.]
MKKPFNLPYNIFRNIFVCLIFALFLLWSIYCFFSFYSNSKLVYSYKENVLIKNVDLEFDGSLSSKDLHLKTVYDAINNTICCNDITIKGYQWSKITSIHRLIFLDKERIKNAGNSEKIYFHLYRNNRALFLNNKIFGLSLKNPPSKIYLYSDYFRDSTKIGFVILVLLLSIITYMEKKFKLLNNNVDLLRDIPTPVVILFTIILLLF